MLLYITCRYCGYEVEKQAYSKLSAKTSGCDKCGDKDLIIKTESPKIDAYSGSPPFPKKISDDWL